jgi:hypothetical protein
VYARENLPIFEQKRVRNREPGIRTGIRTLTTSLGFAGLPRNWLLNISPAGATVLSIIFAGWFLKRAFITRPAFIMIIMAGMLVSFVLLATLESRGGIYAACVLGTVFYSVYFIPFWACKSPFLTIMIAIC